MRVEYHPEVAKDLVDALRTYDAVSARLGDEFLMELCRRVVVAAANPNRFHQVKPGFHRANLMRFPYHFIYRPLGEGIRVTLVRHHRRQPGYGMERE